MNISNFLAPSDITVDVVAADKQKLLQALARKAGAMIDVLPDHVMAELRKREELGSTGVGGGVALPHARFHQVSRPTGILLRLRKPIDYDAVDGKPVDIVFLLLLPDSPVGAQLGALAAIARLLRKAEIAEALRKAHDSTEMYRVLAAAG